MNKYTPERWTWNLQNEGLENNFPFHMGDFQVFTMFAFWGVGIPGDHQDWIPGEHRCARGTIIKGKAMIWADQHYLPWHFLGEAFIQAIISLDFTSLHSLIFAFPSFHFMPCHVIPFISFCISFPSIYLCGSFHFIYCCVSFHSSHFCISSQFIPSNIPRSPSTPSPKTHPQTPPKPTTSHYPKIIKSIKSKSLDIVASHQITTLSTFR